MTDEKNNNNGEEVEEEVEETEDSPETEESEGSEAKPSSDDSEEEAEEDEEEAEEEEAEEDEEEVEAEEDEEEEEEKEEAEEDEEEEEEKEEAEEDEAEVEAEEDEEEVEAEEEEEEEAEEDEEEEAEEDEEEEAQEDEEDEEEAEEVEEEEEAEEEEHEEEEHEEEEHEEEEEDADEILGLAAFFDHPDHLLYAAEQTRAAAYDEFDAYSPFPIHGMDEAMGLARSWIPWVCFFAGLTGLSTAMTIEFGIMAFDWPMVFGGKPFAAWPSFVPVMFELTVLFAGVITAVVMLAAAGCFRKPLIISPEITNDRFVLWISAADAHFDTAEVNEFMKGLNPMEIRTIREDADQ